VAQLLELHHKTDAYAQEVFSLLVVELWHRQFTDATA
jgi:hypothetical protein